MIRASGAMVSTASPMNTSWPICRHTFRRSREVGSSLRTWVPARLHAPLSMGVSRESTMGFTALDGLPMATRPGRLDPGILLWMMKQGMGHDEIQDLLYNRSGMKGLSGIAVICARCLIAMSRRHASPSVFQRYRTAGCIAGLGVASKGLPMPSSSRPVSGAFPTDSQRHLHASCMVGHRT